MSALGLARVVHLARRGGGGQALVSALGLARVVHLARRGGGG